jgi:hypothetical protein
MNWQPIETAPHDSVVLLALDDRSVAAAYWDEGFWHPQYSMGVIAWGKPTNWMPLPEAP